MSPDETPWVAEALKGVIEKLEPRLGGRLAEADDIAVRTAVLQAMLAGYRQGVAATVYSAERQAARHGITLTLNIDVDVEDRDPWAELYGDESPLP
jgi:hypothetical protein